MTPIEAAALCRYVKACCPNQHIDQFTPDAWGDLLEDIPFDVAKEAVRQCARKSPYVAPADIVAMVRKLRRLCSGDAERRFELDGDVPPPDAQAYIDWMHQRRTIIRNYTDQAITAREYDPRLLAIETGDAA